MFKVDRDYNFYEKETLELALTNQGVFNQHYMHKMHILSQEINQPLVVEALQKLVLKVLAPSLDRLKLVKVEE